MALIVGALVAKVVPAHAESPSSGAVVLIGSEGSLVRSERDIAAVLVANPEVANVQLVSPRTVFVFGKATGATELFLLDDSESVIAQRRVVVHRPLSAMPRD